jgi:hypothetical protein
VVGGLEATIAVGLFVEETVGRSEAPIAVGSLAEEPE